jgi:hypothetical protein
MIRCAFIVAGLTLTLLSACTTTSGESGSCKTDSECKGNRVCQAGVCAEPGGTSSGTSGTSGSSGTSGTSGSSGTSGGADACAAAGGTKLAAGGCYKTCIHDKRAAGNDLNGDCKALDGMCADNLSGDDYCRPGDGRCVTSDASCKTGWKCVDYDGLKVCLIDCTSDGDCPPSWSCRTSCANGAVKPLGFCQESARGPACTCGEPGCL